MKTNEVIKEVMRLCEAAILVQGALHDLSGSTWCKAKTKRGDHTVSCEVTEVLPEDQGTGKVLKVCDIPQQLNDHTEVLDACLAALSRSSLCKEGVLLDFCIDGDGSDCEAMFAHVDGQRTDFILKVR